jgi:uncharacterized protein (DUF1778 family)
MKPAEKTRFDARLTKEQKELFEYAASLTGSRSLTEFVISSAQKEADKAVKKNQFLLLASKKDQEIFFNTLMIPPKPNQSLKKALARYNKLSAK